MLLVLNHLIVADGHGHNAHVGREAVEVRVGHDAEHAHFGRQRLSGAAAGAYAREG